MKKILVTILVGLSLTLTACGETKLESVKIKGTDSKEKKQLAELYNLDLTYYNDTTTGKMIQFLEKEAKTHPKDHLNGTMMRVVMNYIDYTGDEEGMKNVALLKMISNSSCKPEEYKDVEKIASTSMDSINKIKDKIAKTDKDNIELATLNKEYADALSPVGDLIKDDKIAAQEFLDKEPSKVLKESHEKQKTALLKLKKKIDNMK